MCIRDSHWASGLQDIRHTLEHPEWLELPDNANGFVTHDVHRLRQAAIDRELQAELGPLPGKGGTRGPASGQGTAPAQAAGTTAHQPAQAPAARPAPDAARARGAAPPAKAPEPAVKPPGSARPASPRASRPRG